MSKVAVAIAVPALLASIGLGVVCLELSAQVDELQDALEDQRMAVAEKPAPSEERGTRTGSRREEVRVRAMEDRLRVLETRVVETASVAPTADGAASLAAMEDLPDVLRTPDFDRAVRGVLDARDAERRAERMERSAQQRTKQLLRGLEVDEQLRAQVLAVVSEAMGRRQDLRDAKLDEEAAREQAAELRGELERSLESVLGADQMEAVRPRLDGRGAVDRAKRMRKADKKDDKRRRKREKGADLGS